MPQAMADSWFADGYHGGIYGHYPVRWYTQFIVDRMEQHPDWKLGLEIEPETWDSVKSNTPDAYRKFMDMYSRGRMEYTNPTYAQPYCYNISGESIIRQFKYGIRTLRRHIPGITFSTYACEEPCFTSCLPMILQGFGFRYMSLKCPDTCWGGYMAPMGGSFISLVAPDGTALLTSPRYDCEELQPSTVWQTTAWRNSPHYLRACREAGIESPIGMCYQDAGWRNGPWLGKNPMGSHYVLWTEYFERFGKELPAPEVRFSQMDVRVNLMWGSSVLREIARSVRRAENALQNAEKTGFIASLLGEGFKPDYDLVDECWRQLMLAQHHDSWIVPYNRLWHYGTWADAIRQWTGYACDGARNQALAAAKAVCSGDRLMVKVFNTSLQQRNEYVSVPIPEGLANDAERIVLTDASGKEIDTEIIDTDKIYTTDDNVSKVKGLFFKALVPPLGFACYNIRKSKGEKKVNRSEAYICVDSVVKVSNSLIGLEIDLQRGGTVRSLFVNGTKHQEFAAGNETPYSFGELRGFFYEDGEYKSSKDCPAKLRKLRKTASHQTIEIEGRIGEHPFVQTYTLTEGSPRIDCQLRIDWQGNPRIGEYGQRDWKKDRRGFCDDRYKLCLLMPMGFTIDRVIKDAPFDICECDTAASYFNRWSDIRNNILLNWIDFSERGSKKGIGIITDHVTSYAFGPDYPPAITLQYSGRGLWGVDYKIEGPLECRYSIVVHPGEDPVAAMARESERFNNPLYAVLSPGSGVAETKSVLRDGMDGYRLAAAVCNRDGSHTLRLHNETSDSASRLQFTNLQGGICATNLDDNAIGEESKIADGMPVNLPRLGISTYRLTNIK